MSMGVGTWYRFTLEDTHLASSMSAPWIQYRARAKHPPRGQAAAGEAHHLTGFRRLGISLHRLLLP